MAENLAVGISDWVNLSMVGVGALMGTFGRNAVRAIGIVIIIVAACGAAFTHFYQNAEAQNPSVPGMGSNNTIVNVPPPASMGSGNTIIGPTDSRGNTIISQPGTTIGAGACGNSTSVVIGAGARQKGCEPRK